MNRIIALMAVGLFSVFVAIEPSYSQTKIKYDELTVEALRTAVAAELRTETMRQAFAEKVELDAAKLMFSRGPADAHGKLSWQIGTTNDFVDGDKNTLTIALKQLLRTAVGQNLLESKDSATFYEHVIDKASFTFGDENDDDDDQDPPPKDKQPGGEICCVSDCVTMSCRWRLFCRRSCVIGVEYVATVSDSCRSMVASGSPTAQSIAAVRSMIPEDFVDRILVAVRGTGDSGASNLFVTTAAAPAQGPAAVAQPELAAALFGEGYHAFWQKDYETARNKLERAVVADPDDARGWYYLAMTRMQQGDMEGAMPHFARAVQLHRDGKPGRALVGKSLERVQGELRVKLEEARVRALTSLRSASAGAPTGPVTVATR